MLTIESMDIPVDEHHVVRGDLAVPEAVLAVVVFAHGSGSSRHSVRNRAVAAALNERGLATVLMDLVTIEEEEADRRTREHRFDIDVLADRLGAALTWVRQQEIIGALPIGLFGASTGAAAALVAAANAAEVGAVVSRGGRADLGGAALERVLAPTLLIVGELDTTVIDLNHQAARRLAAPSETVLVEGATHLFEEAGALEAVASHAGDWFLTHLCPQSHDSGLP